MRCALTVLLSLLGFFLSQTPSVLGAQQTEQPDPKVVSFITSEEESRVEESTGESEEEALEESTENLVQAPQEKEQAKEIEKEKKTEEKPSYPFFGPLPTRNQHPLYALFFNFPADSARTTPKGASELSLRLQGANTIVKKTQGAAIVDLDLESWTYHFSYRRGFDASELMVTLPFSSNSHGFMDDIIARWHGFFGLPKGKRPLYPENDFRYYVRTRDGDILNFPSDKFGIGDIALVYKHRLGPESPRSRLAYRVGVKLPTGDADKGLGSGGTDLGVGVLWDTQGRRFATYSNLNFILIGDDEFGSFSKKSIFSGMLGAEYSLRPSVTITSQIDYSQAPFKTGSPSADRASVEILFGFHRLFKNNFMLSGGFSEDFRAETAPDFSLIAELKWFLSD